jgi:hypothetical protein
MGRKATKILEYIEGEDKHLTNSGISKSTIAI